MNLADLPWRPMDDVPKRKWIVILNASSNAYMLEECLARKSDRGWLTLAEFDKLVNGEDAGI